VIDTHCHLLPRVDDGPRSEETALALARDLVADGVGVVLCTPHLSRLFSAPHSEVLRRFTSLKDALVIEEIPLGLAVAAEVSASFALSEPLVELHPDTPAHFLELCTDRLAEAALLPVFAHPERCRAVQRDPSLLDSVRAGGAMTQLVAPSLIGRWGGAVEASAWELLRAGRVDLLGSDAHGIESRRCHLREAADLIEAHFGADVRTELTERQPAKLVRLEPPRGATAFSAPVEEV
jgi:protein-tyrosine phosphatase